MHNTYMLPSNCPQSPIDQPPARYAPRMTRGQRLDELTQRWRRRHDARLPAERPAADPDREALASRAFPFRTESPASYVEAHGTDMIGFTYDEARYADPDLDAWIVEVGSLLRSRR